MEKVNGNGGYPLLPLSGPKIQKFFGVFHPKKHCFWPKKFMEKKLTERGGTPSPPLTDGWFPKTERKKVNGKGGTPPPPFTDIFRDWWF